MLFNNNCPALVKPTVVYADAGKLGVGKFSFAFSVNTILIINAVFFCRLAVILGLFILLIKLLIKLFLTMVPLLPLPVVAHANSTNVDPTAVTVQYPLLLVLASELL